MTELLEPIKAGADFFKDFNIHEVILLLLGGTGGGVIVKMLDLYLRKHQLDDSSEASYRVELRADLEKLKKEVQVVNEKYRKLFEEHALLRAEYILNKTELEHLRQRLEKFDTQQKDIKK